MSDRLNEHLHIKKKEGFGVYDPKEKESGSEMGDHPV